MATATEAAHGIPSSSNNSMDPKLWGNLQHHIGLETVYAKLPLREFFRNRAVCKEWNCLADDRAFLEDNFKCRGPLLEPYFFLESRFVEQDKLLLLARDHLTGLWSTTQLPSNSSSPYSQWCHGFALYKVLRKGSQEDDELQVFDLDTRVVTHLPPSPPSWIGRRSSEAPVFGMVVDRSVRPYTWKLVKGCSLTMQMYDSRTNTWTMKRPGIRDFVEPVVYWRSETERRMCKQTGHVACCSNGGPLYSQCPRGILVYINMVDRWMRLDLPLDAFAYLSNSIPAVCIGAWQDRIFSVAVDCRPFGAGKCVIRVWELDGGTFSRMPEELCSLLESKLGHPLPAEMQIRASYCDGYFLMHAWLCNDRCMVCKVGEFSLFNMATQVWQKLEVPFGAIHVGISLHCKHFKEPPITTKVMDGFDPVVLTADKD